MVANEPTTLAALRERGNGRALTHCSVTVQVKYGPVTSNALGAGGLALHRDHDGRDQLDTYTVTHVASGLAAIKEIPSRALARGVLAVLLDAYDHWERPQSELPAKELGPLCRRLRHLVRTKESSR